MDSAHRTPISSYKTTEVLLLPPLTWPLLLLLSFVFAGARVEARMAEVMPDWCMVLVCVGLAALLGVSALLCSMILDDRRDAAARVLALRGGGDDGLVHGSHERGVGGIAGGIGALVRDDPRRSS